MDKFKANERESKYLRDLPLHRSQKEIQPGVFKIKVIPDRDLIMELCKRGPAIEILEPASVREKVAELHKAAAELYDKN